MSDINEKVNASKYWELPQSMFIDNDQSILKIWMDFGTYDLQRRYVKQIVELVEAKCQVV